MNFPLFIARRLSLNSGGRKSAPAVKVAVIAVALSVGVMLASIAIVRGFKHEITEKVTGFNSDLTLYVVASENNDSPNVLSLTPTIKEILGEQPYIKSYSLESTVPAIFKTPTDFKGIYFKGYGEGYDTTFLTSNLEEGRLPRILEHDNKEIVISRMAANQLGLHAGDSIDTYFISNDVRVRRLKISGIFNSHFDNYDDVFVYGPTEILYSVAPIGKGEGTSIKVKTDDFRQLRQYSDALSQRLIQARLDEEIYRDIRVDNALDAGAPYFSWLSLLDTNVAVILILMTIVAAITLIGGMLIIILDKLRFIGLMKSLGASNATVSRIFLLLAVKIAIWGLLAGNVFMLALLYLQDRTHILRLDPDTYYIDFVPVRLAWTDVAWLNLGVLAVMFLILILPSRYVARISPARTMRYE